MYNGLEIDMLNLGDADSILVTRWDGLLPSRILIDGGLGKHAEDVINFLEVRGVKRIDALVCTHIHNDHIGGLVRIVRESNISIGASYLHIPENHLDYGKVQFALDSVTKRGYTTRVSQIQESLSNVIDLRKVLIEKGITIYEPFQGDNILFLTVCSPTEEFYREKLSLFADTERLLSSVIKRDAQSAANQFRNSLLGEGIISDALLEAPTTDPENETSIVTAAVTNNRTKLLTADAGIEALTIATNRYKLENLDFMQLPHHGSRHNITTKFIQYFKPRIAFSSAVGNVDHPRRAVVNYFKSVGSAVFSTHWPRPHGENLLYWDGEVPTRTGYGPAIPLYEEKS